MFSGLKKSAVLKNRLTLWAKFMMDTRGQFLNHGRTVKPLTLPVTPPSATKKILCPTVFYLDRGLAWQTTIAKAFEVRGHDVVFMPLDIHFPRRNALYFDDQDAGFITPYYNLYTNRLLHGFDFSVQPYSQFGGAQKFVAYRRDVAALSDHECRAFMAHGLPIGKMALNALIHYFRCGDQVMTGEKLEAYRDYLAMGLVLYDLLVNALDIIKPDIIFTLNGAFLDSQLHLALGQARGIRVMTYEAGFMLNSLMLGENRPIISFPMADYLPPAYQSYQLKEPQETQLKEYLNARSRGQDCVFDYWGNPIFDHKKIRQELGLSAEMIPDILFTNLLWDSAMLDCDIAFTSQLEWIAETVDYYAAHPDRTLLLRLHPAEVNPPNLMSQDKILDLLKKLRPQLPPNVIVIPPESSISSYPLTEMSNVTMVYSSTAGLESAIMGKPVLVAGKTHYRDQGFTHDITSKNQYFELLTERRLPGSHNDVVAKAKKYAYFFFFGFMIPFPLVTEKTTTAAGELVQFNWQSLDDLLPGRDPSLDFTINAILGSTSYRERLNALLS